MIDRLSSNFISSQPEVTLNGETDTVKGIDNNKPIPQGSNEDTPEYISFPKGKVEEIVNSLNNFIQDSHTSLKFEYHEKLNEYYVTIVNDVTQEVVKEIPPKKMLDFYAAMTEFLGLIVDKKI